MEKHKLLKKISLGIASLALICPLAMSGLNTNANASSRYYFNNVRHPNNPVERAFDRKGWTSGPMFDFTGAHITIHGRRYTVHGTSDVGGYITTNGHRHHARRTHRAYRHHRRARMHRARRRHRSHRRVARRRVARKRHAHKAHRHHRAHRSRRHYAEYDNYADDAVVPRPVYHHRNHHYTNSIYNLARWYKANGGNLYANDNGAGSEFNMGWSASITGAGIDTNDYNSSAHYKEGWIDGASLELNNNMSKVDGSTTDISNALNSQPISNYARAINVWNKGYKILNDNPTLASINMDLIYNGGNSWSWS